MRNFSERFQSAHGWGNVTFSTDFRVAFSVKQSTTNRFPFLDHEAEAVELSTEERQQAESLYREVVEAERAVGLAQKNYADYSNELVADRFPHGERATLVELCSGRKVTIPQSWVNGVTFTPGFRIAVPLKVSRRPLEPPCVPSVRARDLVGTEDHSPIQGPSLTVAFRSQSDQSPLRGQTPQTNKQPVTCLLQKKSPSFEAYPA